MFYKGNVNTLFQLLSISENFEVNITKIFLGHNERNLKLLIEWSGNISHRPLETKGTLIRAGEYLNGLKFQPFRVISIKFFVVKETLYKTEW